jgi:hypothetical protein
LPQRARWAFNAERIVTMEGAMYYLGETSVFIWNVQIDDWRWQLDPDEPEAETEPIGDSIETAVLAIGALSALEALALPENEAAETPRPEPTQPRKAPTAPLAAESDAPVHGHWVLAGMKTLWGMTMLYDPIRALTQELAVQDDVEADRRRGERHHRDASEGRLAFREPWQLERKLSPPDHAVRRSATARQTLP